MTLSSSSSSSSSSTSSSPRMKILRIVKAGISHPFGDTRQVNQAFPVAIPTEDSDPFLLCDYFHSTEMDDVATHDDDFPIGWHPHRGFDIATYIKQGKGRHGDSLGNRVTYDSPGLQWMSTGSGVYHAEGGATPKGQTLEGFQIWINVPSDNKLDDPRYGTVQPKDLPIVSISPNCTARILAGTFNNIQGPFTTVQPVLMIDLELTSTTTTSEIQEENSDESTLSPVSVTLNIDKEFDTVILYLYHGSLSSINDHTETLSEGSVILMDASSSSSTTTTTTTTSNSNNQRQITMTMETTIPSSPSSTSSNIMVFAGKRLNQPIAWHGSIVMTDEYEIANTMSELRGGFFPPVCVSWDYRQLSSKTEEEEEYNDDDEEDGQEEDEQ